MPRLFPGVDPFIEVQNFWPGFHGAAITYCRDAISEHLPDHYDVWIEERVQLVEYPAEGEKHMRPDVLIDRSAGFYGPGHGAAILEVERTTIPATFLDEVREPFLNILHRPDQTLVTVVELLSPDNKTGAGHVQYLAKRNALLHSSVHIVELDFLVAGHRLPMGRPLPVGDAYAIVARGDRRPDCDVYAWSIRQPLTRIRIPLLAPQPRPHPRPRRLSCHDVRERPLRPIDPR